MLIWIRLIKLHINASVVIITTIIATETTTTNTVADTIMIIFSHQSQCEEKH